MRMEREFFKPRREGVYLHVYNHTVTLENDPLPLEGREKQKFISTFERYLVKYNIEVISLVVMGNHYHALLYCDHAKLDLKEACKAFNTFHSRKKDVDEDHHRVKVLQDHSNNFSEFMRETQRDFSYWFNRSRSYKRKGALWQDRFQCQLIESDVYLWACLKYIEMNPVRARICPDAEAYDFSSYGRWKDRHPYEGNFIKHVLSIAEKATDIKGFKTYMKQQMNKMKKLDYVAELESTGKISEAGKVLEQIKKESNESDIIIFTFAKQDWMSGKVIGSEEFIKKKYREWRQYQNSA